MNIIEESDENISITSNKKEFNYQMCVLSAIGMLAVMLGHLANSSQELMTLNGWFPYYAYHMPLFIFVSGYFYNQNQENHLGEFVLKKFRTMVLPFYLVNGAFYLLQSLLKFKGFTIGDTFSLKTWIINPWIRVQPINFSIPTWYLIAIFLAELFYVLLRKFVSNIFRMYSKKYELTLLFITLVAGIASVVIVRKTNPAEWMIVYLRSVIMMFFLEIGYIYRLYYENIVRKINTAKYFITLFFIQGIMIALLHGNLDSGLWGITNGFQFYGTSFYVEGIIGIAFWLRISEFIAEIPQKFNSLVFIGKNSKWVMSFHLFGYFILNTLVYVMLKITNSSKLNDLFDVNSYKTQIYYCVSKKQLAIIYVLFGLLITFVLIKIGQFIKTNLKRVIIQEKNN
jgi:fucose 4-O-acetylase-like acetyltransferase